MPCNMWTLTIIALAHKDTVKAEYKFYFFCFAEKNRQKYFAVSSRAISFARTGRISGTGLFPCSLSLQPHLKTLLS